MFLLIEFCCVTPPSCLKVIGSGGVGGLYDFSVSPKPFSFGFESKGLGPGLDNIYQHLHVCVLDDI